MQIFKRILFALAGIAMVLAAIGFFLPRTAEVERSVSIGASAEKIYPLINDFQRFNDWSPWARRDFGAQGKAEAYFDLTPEGDGTRVVWGFHTDFGTNLIGRYMGLMFDEWIGADYEAGLVNLKQLAEGG